MEINRTTAEGDMPVLSGVVRQRLAACQAMNLSALERATGRAGEAIRQALETLIAAGEVEVLAPIAPMASPGRVFYRLRRADDEAYLWEQTLDETSAPALGRNGLAIDPKEWWWRPRDRAFAALEPMLGWAHGA